MGAETSGLVRLETASEPFVAVKVKRGGVIAQGSLILSDTKKLSHRAEHHIPLVFGCPIFGAGFIFSQLLA